MENRFLRANAIAVANVKNVISMDIVNSGIITPLKVKDNAVTGEESFPKLNVACICVGCIGG